MDIRLSSDLVNNLKAGFLVQRSGLAVGGNITENKNKKTL
jgi:hypothetical protein